jgi:hypothetical protein
LSIWSRWMSEFRQKTNSGKWGRTQLTEIKQGREWSEKGRKNY